MKHLFKDEVLAGLNILSDTKNYQYEKETIIITNDSAVNNI